MSAAAAILSALLGLAVPPSGPIDLRPAEPERLDERAGRRHLTPDQRLDERLEALLNAESEERAEIIADEVRSLWRQQGGPTAELLMQRADIARRIGDPATAERQYAHLRQLEPEFSEGWLLTAELAMADGNWGFAFDALTEAVSLEPRRFDAYVLLGRTLERSEAPAAALEAYLEALRIHPWHPQARAGRSRLEEQLTGRAL
jgi:tetratricopeptide (TPR) repeat protein